MPIVSLAGFSFSGLAMNLNYYQVKHTETRICHARPFTSMFLETSLGSCRMIKVNSDLLV
jgi:hypothetical protein